MGSADWFFAASGSLATRSLETGEAVKLTITDVPPSPNKVLGKHWSTKAGEKDKWVLLVRSKIVPCVIRSPERKQVLITLCHSRRYDADNAYAAVKPLVDALKHWNLIWDDSAKWIDLMVVQEKCPHKQRHTIVELEAA